MGNRAHWALLEKYPWLRRRGRGVRADGPQKWIKRVWNRKRRMQWKAAAHQDEAGATWLTRAGDRWDWY